MSNEFGPGHYPTTGAVAERPTPINTALDGDMWFAPCDAQGNGGTAINAQWLNLVLAELRNAYRAAGAQGGEGNEKKIAEAMTRSASGGVFAADSGSANAYVLASPSGVDGFVMPKSLFDGMIVVWRPANPNTGPSTANAYGLGVKPILGPGGAALAGGEIITQDCAMRYSIAANGGAGAFILFAWSVASTPQAARYGECRLVKSGSNLVLQPYHGNRISFPNGASALIPSGGVSLVSTGLSAGTLYYIYAKIVSSALQIEASATGHATHAGTGIEVKSDDATKVLVGAAFVVAGPAFADSASQRFVLSWFNRRPRTAKKGLSTEVTTSSTSTIEVHSSLRVEFICWAGDNVRYDAGGTMGNTGVTNGESGIGIDSTSVPQLPMWNNQSNNFGGNYDFSLEVGGQIEGLSEGYHYSTVLTKVYAGGGQTYIFRNTGGPYAYSGVFNTITVNG